MGHLILGQLKLFADEPKIGSIDLHLMDGGRAVVLAFGVGQCFRHGLDQVCSETLFFAWHFNPSFSENGL